MNTTQPTTLTATIDTAARTAGGPLSLADTGTAIAAFHADGGTTTLPELYRVLERTLPLELCPIEAGILGNLIDHECEHDALPTDGTFPSSCFCWPRAIEQNSAQVIQMPKRRTVRPAAVAGSPERQQVVAIVAEFIERLGRDITRAEYQTVAAVSDWPDAPSTRGWRPIVLEARKLLRERKAAA
jgi:hypothetical protein